MKNAAAEQSPGTTNRGAAFHPTDGRPSINKVAPSRRNAIPRNWSNRSVWSRERRGSVMRVVPSANKAASNRADLICALATGEAAAQMLGRFVRLTRPISYLGLPVVCANAGFTKAGMPIGMQLIAPPLDEATALRAGHAFQRATDWHLRAPL